MVIPPFPPEETEDEPGQPVQLQHERKIKAAMAWLREALKDGPRPGKELTDLAENQGHARRTLALARERLYVHSVREDKRYIWYTAAQWKQARKVASKT